MWALRRLPRRKLWEFCEGQHHTHTGDEGGFSGGLSQFLSRWLVDGPRKRELRGEAGFGMTGLQQ